MARQLDLSEEQVAKITQLYKELAESGGDPAALRESISEILTPEQQARAEEIEAEREERRSARRERLQERRERIRERREQRRQERDAR